MKDKDNDKASANMVNEVLEQLKKTLVSKDSEDTVGTIASTTQGFVA